MSPLARFKDSFASAVLDALGLTSPTSSDLARQIKVPEPEHGDLALPCFLLAKALSDGKPPAVASRVAEAIGGHPLFSDVKAVGPYVNVRLEAKALAEAVLGAARSPGYGDGEEGKGRSVVLDYSSPNIAKPLAFHHIRSTVIGQSIARLHEARGWRVVRINYLGDWGKQFGLLATGFARYGDPNRRGDAKHLVEVYVRANQEADVASRKAAIAAPAEARALAERLKTIRSEATDSKAEKEARSAEKKLRSMLGGLEPLDAGLAALDAKAAEAQASLPEAESRDAEARAFFRRMEEGEPEALAAWRAFREASIEEFLRVYARMGVEFDSIEGESFYGEVLEETVERVRHRPGTRIDDGAEVVELELGAGKPPVLLKTRDGTTLYVTRDIAAAIDRQERFRFDRALYVVAADQSLHFEQLFSTLAAMGFPWAGALHHVPFGRVQGMSTRRGQLVFLDEVLEEATQRARAVCERSEKIDPVHLDRTVEAIGVGAVVFGDLKNLRTSDYRFDWEDVLDLRGHTAPYVQFAHARACSILDKAGGAPSEAPSERLTLDEERRVLCALAAWPDVVLSATEAFEPSLVARALLDLAQSTAAWLSAGNKDRELRVLHDSDEGLRLARLALVDAVRRTLQHGLRLLGVAAPEAM